MKQQRARTKHKAQTAPGFIRNKKTFVDIVKCDTLLVTCKKIRSFTSTIYGQRFVYHRNARIEKTSAYLNTLNVYFYDA